ncbi:MAG: PAS domain S-box protein [Methanobacteriaceae archaeon]|nr:PAS domain S-box protein [Methanobacteriaceae archaeon]
MGEIRILLVEDDSIEALDIKRTLESHGFTVPYVASSGEDAVSKAHELLPDLILMDILLKGEINGIEAAKEIKELNIPIIYLTAHSEESTVEKAMLTEPYGYLIKPYVATELKYAIELAVYKNKMEKELKASESRYNSLFEKMLNGFAYHQIVVDDKGEPVDYIFLKVNEAFEKFTGLKRDDIIGRSVTEVIPDIKTTNPQLIMDYGYVALSGESKVFEIYFAPFDKYFSITAYSDQKGYFATIFEDITLKRQSEKALEESEKRYRGIIENMLDAYIRADKEGKITMASPSAARMYRYDSPQQMMGISAISLYKSQKDRETLLEELGKHGIVQNMEGEALRNDGTSFWVSMNAQYNYDENGEILGTEAFVRDISRTKKAEEALKKSESYYRAIFEHTGTATVIIEDDTIISLANKEFEKLSGYTRGEIEGKKCWTEFVHEDDLERMKEYHRLRRIDPKAAPEIYDFRFINREGKTRYVHLEVDIIPGTKKSVASLLDITARKNAEERIDRLYRLYATLSQVNQAVVRVKDTQELFNKICEVCVKYGKFKMAWIGLIDLETGNINPVAHSGDEKGYLDNTIINLHEKPPVDWPTVQAINTGELVIINDIKKAPNQKWRDNALKRGYNSLASLPIKLRGEVMGILNIYSERMNFFHDEEITLVEEMGLDISMAVDSIKTEKERREMEKALRLREEELKFTNEWLSFAQKAAKSGFWDWDMSTGKLTWSREFYELFGLPSTAEPSFDTWLESLHPDDREEAMDNINHAIEDHQFLENEYRVILPDGNVIWIRALGSTYYDAEDKPVRMSGICLDVTQQKKTENEILSQFYILRGIIESSGNPILSVDTNYCYTSFNRSHQAVMKALYGADIELGKNLLEYQTVEEDRNKAQRNFDRALNGESFIDEYYLGEEELSRLYFEISYNPIKDKEGKVIGVALYAQDVTLRKKAEEELRRSLKEKENLLREVHHRVKNNLQIVSSLLNLQSQQVKDEKDRELFRVSQDRLKSMAHVHGKLYESRDLSSINFREYVAHLTRELMKSYPATNAELDVEVEEVTLNIETSVPCGLIINELVSNSLRYAFPQGRTGKIKVSLKKIEETNGAEYELIISDNGVGLPEEMDFKHSESLGMQLVINLVNQLEGEIDLDRSKGTKFKIVFKELEYDKRI